MIVINDLDKLKITSVHPEKGTIHFNYAGEFYFIHENRDETTNTSLYKGRCRGQNECIKSVWGFINNPIKYKNNKRVLSAIDKQFFIEKIYSANLINTDIKEIKEKVEYKNKRKQQLNEIIQDAYEELRKLNWE